MKSIFNIFLLLLSINLIAQTDTMAPAIQFTVHTPTNALQQSIDFYTKLKYQPASKSNPNLLTDGNAIIEINPDRYARAGVKMYKASWAKEVEALKKLTKVHETKNGFLLTDLNGCYIYLEEGELEIDHELPGVSSGMAGNFQGVSLEAANMEKALEIWETFGFKIIMGKLEGGFLVIQHPDGFSVSLMQPMSCPHLFFNPSMTFFNGEQNLNIIKNIRAAGIPIAEEITIFNKEGIVDNIIIRDPGGYGFFIFSD